MNDVPQDYVEPKNLVFLRRLVTILIVTMIAGLLTIIGLFVMRLSQAPQRAPLPAEISLPDGSRAQAFTQAGDWYAVVTTDNRILIYNRSDGTLRQTVKINP
jgi:Family of unknown function (DUF6476)